MQKYTVCSVAYLEVFTRVKAKNKEEAIAIALERSTESLMRRKTSDDSTEWVYSDPQHGEVDCEEAVAEKN